MCFTKPGAWLPAQRSAALCSCLSTKRASLPNLCSEPVLGLLPRWKPPKAYCLPFISAHSKHPAASRSLLQFTSSGPPLSHGDQEVPAGQAPPAPAPARPGPRARPSGARPRLRGSKRSRCRPPRRPRTLRRAPHPPAQQNKMFAAYDFQFQRLANGVQTSASSE